MLPAPSSPGADPLPTVGPPPGPVFRIGRGFDPFDPLPWHLAHVDGTFGNRFDDPSARRGVPVAGRYRMVYCATQREAAFGETIARFRPNLDLLARLAGIDDDEPIDPDLYHPIIPAEWRLRRRVGVTRLDLALRFVDLADPATIQRLREPLAAIALALNLPDIDLSAVTGPQRLLTQELARYLYEQVDPAGEPRYAGIRYLSRLNPAWELWAVYDTRMIHYPSPPEPIFPDDPGLLAAARLFGLRIESLHGHVIVP